MHELGKLNMSVGRQNVQTIPCVDIEEAKAETCPCPPPSGMKWLKSKKPLPRFINLVSITSTIGETNMNYVEWTKVKYKVNSRVKSSRSAKYYTIRDTGEGSFLYVLNDRNLKLVAVSAIFEDPYEVITFEGCGKIDKTKLCNPWDTPFYANSEQIDKVCTVAWSVLPTLKANSPSDIYNNDSDDVPGTNLKI